MTNCVALCILLNYYLDLFKIIMICMYILLKVGGRLGNSKPLFSLGLHHWCELHIKFSDGVPGGAVEPLCHARVLASAAS